MARKDDAILTPQGVASFINLDKPRAMPGVAEAVPRYSINLIFDKAAQATPEFAALQAGIDKAIRERWPGKVPPKLSSPFRDGAEKAGEYKGYKAGDLFIQPWTKDKPPVINRHRQDVIDFTEFHAGWSARAFVVPWAYDTAGKRGVIFMLNSVQFLKPGPRLDGRATAADFPDVEEDETEDVI